jgi:hypothetical protein
MYASVEITRTSPQHGSTPGWATRNSRVLFSSESTLIRPS